MRGPTRVRGNRRPNPVPALMVVGAVVLLAGGVLAGHLHHQKGYAAAVTGNDTPARILLKGTVVAKKAPADCTSAANGVKQGATVAILDPAGSVLGSTNLGPGMSANGGGCTWAYSLQVPVVTSYQIQVAGLPVAGVARTVLAKQAWNFYENDTTDTSQLENIEAGV